MFNATLADAGLTHSQWTVDDTNKRFTYTGDDTRDFLGSCIVFDDVHKEL